MGSQESTGGNAQGLVELEVSGALASSLSADDSIWTCANPAAWPDPPSTFSPSTLLEIESCPRRWALRRATFSNVAGERYPERPALAAVRGLVVHGAIEAIIRALASTSGKMAEATYPVLRDLGGLSAVLDATMEEQFSRYADNPRARPVLESLRRNVAAGIPSMRAQVQRVLGRVAVGRGKGQTWAPGRLKGRLSRGTYAEVVLRHPSGHWVGVVDLLAIEERECEIRDHKTGVPKPADEWQIRTYGWLLANDRARNPGGRMATSLVLGYPSGDTAVEPLSVADLEAFGEDLTDRRQSAIAAIDADPPPAIPEPETCRYCPVRHLCPEYWPAQNEFPWDSDRPYGDLQVVVGQRRGPNSWDGEATHGPVAVRNQSVILNARGCAQKLQSGTTIRALGVHLASRPPDPNWDAKPLVSLTGGTEVFEVPPSISA